MTAPSPPPSAAAGPDPAPQSVNNSRVAGDVYQIAHARDVRIVPRPPTPKRTTTVLGGLLLIAGVLTAVFFGPRLASMTGPESPPTGDAGALVQPGVAPGTDIAMHLVWPSSQANVRHAVPEREWVMTNFKVTLPYVRSVEVAAMYDADVVSSGAATDNVLLRVLDEHGTEIAQGEAPIVNYRAKVTFLHAVDVRDYLDQHLYLQVLNISGGPIRVYMSNHDMNRSVTSYVSCGVDPPVRCPNPIAQDLSALVSGRNDPW